MREGSRTHGYPIDFALDDHGSILAAIQANDMADLAIFYCEPWLVLLVFLGRHRQV